MSGLRSFIIDTHVHYYPAFSPEVICRKAVRNLDSQASESLPGIVLVDRSEWPSYADFISTLSAIVDFRVESHQDHAVIIFSEDDLVHRLYVFKGAQRVTDEGVEILSLFSSELLSFEKQPIEDIMTQIDLAGGLLVVPWSYGKWLGKRRLAVQRVCQLGRQRGQPVFLGDICQRPKFIDNLSVLAVEWGATGILGGSDPLPIAQEVANIGTLGTSLEVGDNFKSLTLVADLKKAIFSKRGEVIGSHDSITRGAYRWIRYVARKNKNKGG